MTAHVCVWTNSPTGLFGLAAIGDGTIAAADMQRANANTAYSGTLTLVISPY